MHELSIALNIIDIACEESRSRGAAAVVAVHARIGRLSGVDSQALQSAFELAKEGTLLTDAVLKIEDMPVKLFCRLCASEQPAHSLQNIRCAKCGTISSQITQGRELEVVAMELEAVEQVP